MQIQLIDGNFSAQESIELLSKIIQVKIQFHEQKIHKISGEEEIKMRENRIKKLQKELAEVRLFIENQTHQIHLNCKLHLA
jgi:hypothetical protein